MSEHPPQGAAGSDGEDTKSGQRLQKIIAAAGLASRRKAEELILEGRVQVNGEVITELGTRADPERDHIRVDGKLLQGGQKHRYFVLNKPKGYVTTVRDPEGRPTVMDFFKASGVRLYPVGRLDYQSEGLLLMTNDGELANALTRASAGVEKTYLVKVSGQPSEAALDQLRSGIMIDRGRRDSREGRVMTQPARIQLVRDADNPWYEVILTEGRNREIRKMFEEIGHFVEKIRRVGYGPLVLDLPPGESRELASDEVAELEAVAAGRRPRRSAPSLAKTLSRTVKHPPRSTKAPSKGRGFPSPDVGRPRPTRSGAAAPGPRPSRDASRATRPPQARSQGAKPLGAGPQGDDPRSFPSDTARPRGAKSYAGPSRGAQSRGSKPYGSKPQASGSRTSSPRSPGSRTPGSRGPASRTSGAPGGFAAGRGKPRSGKPSSPRKGGPRKPR